MTRLLVIAASRRAGAGERNDSGAATAEWPGYGTSMEGARDLALAEGLYSLSETGGGGAQADGLVMAEIRDGAVHLLAAHP